MKNNTIITISRQYGSGGRLIGQKLAERLGIPFYDKELITLAAEESGFAEHLFEKNDRNITNSLLYSLSMYGNTMGLYDMPLNDKLFIAQSKTIQSVAEKGPCVIVGAARTMSCAISPMCSMSLSTRIWRARSAVL